MADLEDWGWNLGIFAISALRIAVGAVRGFLGTLHDERTQLSAIPQMATRAEMDELLGLNAIRRDEERIEGLFGPAAS